MSYNFPVIITQDKSGMYIAHVPSLRGCHTQAKSLATLHKRLPEAIELCLEVEKSKKQPIPQTKFISLEQIEVDI
ncbi:type II toxin-antitoxin system HicB family antitoxin [Candidatus Peribacteria bacterium]|nr:type II toxin-antitoxin system HicB family antitoxin [Candidatus Peribacteria bacterium]